jgi:MFS family permease
LDNRRQALQGWLLVGVAFITLALGYAIRNSFSVFYPTIVEEFGWERAGTALMFSLAVIVYGVVAPVAGSLIDRFNPRVVVPIGACVVGGGFALCSLATAQWHFYLLYGVVTAVGLSVIGWTPISAVISRRFTARRGMVFGILGAGFGTSLVSAYVAQSLIDSVGWQWAYVIQGIATVGVIAPLCGILLRGSPPTAPQPSERAASAGDSGWNLPRALRSYRFWLLFAAIFCLLGIAEQILIVHQVYFFRDVGYEPMRAATLYTVFGVAFVAGNLCSYLSDRLGRRTVFTPTCLLGAGATLLLLLIKDTSNVWLPWLTVAGAGVGVGLAGPVFFATVADIFQGRHFGSIQGVITLGFAIGGAISPWAAGYLHDRTGSYFTTYLVVAGAFVASAALLWFAAPRRTAKTG